MLPIFLINLDKRADRLAYVSEQLTTLGLTFRRFAAIDGSLLSMDSQTLFDVPRFILEQKKRPVIGEVGCALSHRALWQTMLDEHLDYALILEDDIKLDPALLALLAKPSFYKQFDFLNLSSFEPYYTDNAIAQQLLEKGISTRLQAKEHGELKKWQQLEHNPARKDRGYVFKLHSTPDFLALPTPIIACECDPAPPLASGYLLSKKSAHYFLQASERLFFPIDLVWRYAGGELIQAFLAHPLILQSLNDTNIAGRHTGYKLNQWQKIQRIFKKSRNSPRKRDVKKRYGDYL